MNKLDKLKMIMIFVFVIADFGQSISYAKQFRQGMIKRLANRSADRKNSRRNIFKNFKSLDQNNDNVVSEQELSVVKRQQILAKIKQMDANGNGSISYQEVADHASSRINKIVEKLKEVLQKRAEENMSEPIDAKALNQNFSALKLKSDFFDEFDKNQDGKIDKKEGLASLNKLIAAIFAKRAKVLMNMVGSSPEKYAQEKSYSAACAMDYDANQQITGAEFKRFAIKTLGENVIAYYRKNSQPKANSQQSGAKISSEPDNLAKPVKPAEIRNPEANNTPDSFIIPEFSDAQTNEVENETDPLQEMLGVGAEEDLLW